VRELVRKNLRWFIFATAAALLLRLLFLIRFPAVVTDSFVYGDIAKNWLQHGIYGLSGPDEVSPTYIRLPGYPGFLTVIFAIFGMEHYRTALMVQIFVDLGTCFFCADIALRLHGPKFAKWAFLLAALCPFLANYSAVALTETLEVFFTAAALDFALAALQESALHLWAVCGGFCAGAILLRPDGGLLLIATLLYLSWNITFPKPSMMLMNSRRKLIRDGLLVTVISLLPLVPWTLRNWRTFHRFEPLTPRYANEENEFVPMGFNRWVKTWIADYTSVEEIYWPVPGSPIEAQQLPSRAFDNPQQREDALKLISEYNGVLHITPELDAGFEALASERIQAHPLRYYFVLPTLRILSMWLRPRTEMLPCDSRWWEFNDELRWSVLAVAFGVINLAYVLCAAVGWLRMKEAMGIGLLMSFVGLRSVFLGTLENPEPRYTLEMFPILIILAAGALVRGPEAETGVS
jgi:4-amino-4-deoxy-L-arabinose transferase-like glycosyltransferase